MPSVGSAWSSDIRANSGEFSTIRWDLKNISNSVAECTSDRNERLLVFFKGSTSECTHRARGPNSEPIPSHGKNSSFGPKIRLCFFVRIRNLGLIVFF